jgi:hypothetical protein
LIICDRVPFPPIRAALSGVALRSDVIVATTRTGDKGLFVPLRIDNGKPLNEFGLDELPIIDECCADVLAVRVRSITFDGVSERSA